MLYDNTSIAVKEITGDGERKPAGEFSRLKSHYLFEVKIRAAGQGQRQGDRGWAGGLCAAELHGARTAPGKLGGTECPAYRAAPPAAGAEIVGHL